MAERRNVDNATYFEITEGHLDIHNPLGREGLELVIRYLGVGDGLRVLDIGCGSGYLGARLAAQWRLDVVGVDNNPWFIDRARRRSDDVSWVLADAASHPVAPGSVDVGFCIGATFALGGFDGTVEFFSRALADAGRVAIGEMYTDDAASPVTELAAQEETRTLTQLCAAAESAGLELVGLVESSTADWDRYRSGAVQGFKRWESANPSDPRVPEVGGRVRAMRDAYIARGRPHYRWATLVLARTTAP